MIEKVNNKIIALGQAIQEGRDSGIAEDFDPEKFLAVLKQRIKVDI